MNSAGKQPKIVTGLGCAWQTMIKYENKEITTTSLHANIILPILDNNAKL